MASDQYALGVMVYEWLRGEPPFCGSLQEIIGQHLYQAPPSLCMYLPQLPPAVEATVFRALAKDPGQRFSTVTAFATALSEAFSTQPFVLGGSLAQSQTVLPLAPMLAVPKKPDHPVGATIPAPPIGGGQESASRVSSYAKTDGRANSKPTRLTQANRQRLLQKVRSFWITGVLDQSLHGTAPLPLELKMQPDAVANPWHLVLQHPDTVSCQLPTGTSITQVYDHANGELLILGAPGSGKTTLLLELARSLLDRAEQDVHHPVPVVFNLSSWAVKRQPLINWLGEELLSKYQVPRKLGQALVDADQILPLLDGLDEVAPSERTACIEAINLYREKHGLFPLVVCCRSADYLAQTTHMHLRSAVAAQPLTQQQVASYLESVGAQALREALLQDKDLCALAATPLMLTILLEVYRTTPPEITRRSFSERLSLASSSDKDRRARERLVPLNRYDTNLRSHRQFVAPPASWPIVSDVIDRNANRYEKINELTSLEAKREKIFATYVQRMLERRGTSPLYKPEQVMHWLSYLAKQMRDHNQTVFYLEHLQPDWLTAAQRRTYTWLAIRLPALVIGVLISILVFLFFIGSTIGSFIELPVLLRSGVLGGFLGSVIRFPRNVGQGEHRPTWIKQLVKRFAISTCIGLLFGLSLGFNLGPYYTFQDWYRDGLPISVIMTGVCLLLQYLLAISSLSSLQNTPVTGWKRVLRFFEAVQGPRALLVVIVTWLLYGPGDGLSYALSYGLSYALISLALNAQTDDIHLTERVRWTWRGLFQSKHLRVTVLITCISTILFWLFFGLSAGPSAGLSVELSYGLSIGLSIGLSYWFVLGLIQGMTQEHIEDRDRHVANQGIRRSLRNSVIRSVVIGPIIGSMGILSTGLGYGVHYGLTLGLIYGPIAGLGYGLFFGLSAAPAIGIIGALLICILTGGLASFRHYIIRFLLSCSRTFPGRAPQFLDDATTRILLRRIGGGYSFVHRLLLDHLADTETTPKASASSSPLPHPEQ